MVLAGALGGEDWTETQIHPDLLFFLNRCTADSWCRVRLGNVILFYLCSLSSAFQGIEGRSLSNRMVPFIHPVDKRCLSCFFRVSRIVSVPWCGSQEFISLFLRSHAFLRLRSLFHFTQVIAFLEKGWRGAFAKLPRVHGRTCVFGSYT